MEAHQRRARWGVTGAGGFAHGGTSSFPSPTSILEEDSVLPSWRPNPCAQCRKESKASVDMLWLMGLGFASREHLVPALEGRVSLTDTG